MLYEIAVEHCSVDKRCEGAIRFVARAGDTVLVRAKSAPRILQEVKIVAIHSQEDIEVRCKFDVSAAPFHVGIGEVDTLMLGD